MENVTSGVTQEGKKFIAYFEGNIIAESYIYRTAEIALEKANGTYIDRRGRKHVKAQSILTNERTDQEIYDDIKMRFETLDLMVQASLCDLNRSMIISAPAGIGKSYGVLKALKESGAYYLIVKGYVSPRQLYLLLYENRHSNNIICFDDADAIFNDENSFNLLKSVCDSSDIRECSWYSSKIINDSDGFVVPNTFICESSIIFITNKNFTEEIDKGTKLSPHFEALRSRSHYVSLGINTKRDYIIRIKQVIETTNILDDFSKATKKDIVDFIEENQNNLLELSLRVVKKISDLIKISSDWKNIAKVTLMV